MKTQFLNIVVSFSLLMMMNIASAETQAAPVSPTSQFNAQQTKNIQKIVHDYIVSNPQVLVEASQVLQEQEMAKAKTKTQQAVIQNSKNLFNSPNSPTIGNHGGDVTVVEFLDYQCAHCREMVGVLDSLIKKDAKLRVVIKDLPIFGGASKFAAQASVAAIKQGGDKYLNFHKGLLQIELPLTNEKILEAAKKSGLNLAQLQTDMKDKLIDDQLNQDFKLAQELGLLGTPAFIVANRQGTRVEYLPGAVTVANLEQTVAKVRDNKAVAKK